MSQLKTCLLMRNPRNLERIGVAWRGQGYTLEKDSHMKSYHYKIEFETSGKHTSAFLSHFTDGRVISASTCESALAQRLFRNTDVAAAQNVGRLLGLRCLQAGIGCAQRGVEEDQLKNSEKLQAFYSALQDAGVVLKEPESIQHYGHWEYPEPTYGQDLELDLKNDVVYLSTAQSKDDVKPKKSKKAKPMSS